MLTADETLICRLACENREHFAASNKGTRLRCTAMGRHVYGDAHGRQVGTARHVDTIGRDLRLRTSDRRNRCRRSADLGTDSDCERSCQVRWIGTAGLNIDPQRRIRSGHCVRKSVPDTRAERARSLGNCGHGSGSVARARSRRGD